MINFHGTDYLQINLIFVFNFLIKKYEEMVSYIKHIVWKYAKHEPENFKLLDVRYNFMKHLILGDCDHLIKLYCLLNYWKTCKR